MSPSQLLCLKGFPLNIWFVGSKALKMIMCATQSRRVETVRDCWHDSDSGSGVKLRDYRVERYPMEVRVRVTYPKNRLIGNSIRFEHRRRTRSAGTVKLCLWNS